jgi:hypothetical protein
MYGLFQFTMLLRNVHIPFVYFILRAGPLRCIVTAETLPPIVQFVLRDLLLCFDRAYNVRSIMLTLVSYIFVIFRNFRVFSHDFTIR